MDDFYYYPQFNKQRDLSNIISEYTSEILTILPFSILNLQSYRRSPSPTSDATKPKYQLVSALGTLYFKFGLTENEVCAEIISVMLAEILNIPIAKTCIAIYKNEVGIVSKDIDMYIEPDDSESYTIQNYIQIPGFIEMCLFDYLIMNEDRHAGNWGISDNKIAPLYDHNICFGGESYPIDTTHFMNNVTSAFEVEELYHNQHNQILAYLITECKKQCELFYNKIQSPFEIESPLLDDLYPDTFYIICNLLETRRLYMLRKWSEYSV